MPTAKKAAPSLDALLETKSEEVNTEEVDFVHPNEDHVHTWKEDPDTNLARVQKDVVVSGKLPENAQVTSTTSKTVYAEASEHDDMGRTITYMDEDE